MAMNSEIDCSKVTAEDLDALAVDAGAALARKEWLDAASSLEVLVSLRPTSPEIRYDLARAYDELGRLDEAIEILTHPSIEKHNKTQRKLVSLYVRAKNFEAAKPLLDELLNEDPDNAKLAKWKILCEEQEADGPAINNRIRDGQALIAANRTQEAEVHFQQLIAEYPENSRAHFQLAQVFAVQKRWADAIRHLRDAVSIAPDNVKMRTALARALAKNGQPAEALVVLDRIVDLERNPVLLLLSQRCQMKLRNWARVDEICERLLTIVPEDHPFRQEALELRQDAVVENEGERLDAVAGSGDLQKAISGFNLLVTHYPESPTAWLKLGLALSQQGRDEEAITALRKAVDLRPSDAKLREALTRVVVRSWAEEDVLLYVQDAATSGWADRECYRWLAQYHNRKHNWQAALDSARKVLAISPNQASARMLVARALMRLGRLAEALDELNVVLDLGVNLAEALQLKADIFLRLARVDDAIELYSEALNYSPDNALINHRLSYTSLLRGDIAGFHRLHEKRRKVKTFIANNKTYPFQFWNGERSIEGKLLVWCEVGLGVGQNILHMTFLKSLASLGFNVVLEVEPRLLELCRRSFPDFDVIPNDAEWPEGITHHTPIGSLSRWFKPDLASFSSLRPFFLPDPAAVAMHRERLHGVHGSGEILVGVSWTSINPFVGDEKSVPLDQLLGSVSVPGVTLVNLQYGDHAAAIARAERVSGQRLADSGVDNSDDLDGLAAVIAAMDLVVCIGHTTAHLAGAIGTPNFVMLPAGPFAHWLARGEQCIWYPATRLFRQAPVDEVWEAVLGNVNKAVRAFVADYDQGSWLASTLLGELPLSLGFAKAMSSQERIETVYAFAAQGAYRSALALLDGLPPADITSALEMLRGDMLSYVGRWETARSTYAALHSIEIGKEDVERRILSADLAMYDLESALPMARVLADQGPEDRLILATILYRLGRHEEALTELRTVSLEAPQLSGLPTLVGTILLELKKFQRAEGYLKAQAAISGRTEEYTLLGRSIAAQGRHADAMAVYDKALTGSFKPYEPAVNFWRTQSRIAAGVVELTPLPPLLGDLPSVSQDDFVVFFAADSSYFWEHGLVLLASLGRNTAHVMCHVHVINPDDNIPSAIDIIRMRLPKLELSYSFEHIDLTQSTEIHIRTYYASVRFVRLAEIFAKRPAHYLCLDVDGVVRHDLSVQNFSEMTGDVGVRMRFDERPQMGMVASASFLRPTAAAAQFINRVSDLIKSTLESQEAVWFLDQVVLNHVLRDLGNTTVAISQLDMTYLDWFFEDHSLIWTGKGRRKSDDNRYTREVQKYRDLHEDDKLSSLIPKRDVGDTCGELPL